MTHLHNQVLYRRYNFLLRLNLQEEAYKEPLNHYRFRTTSLKTNKPTQNSHFLFQSERGNQTKRSGRCSVNCVERFAEVVDKKNHHNNHSYSLWDPIFSSHSSHSTPSLALDSLSSPATCSPFMKLSHATIKWQSSLDLLILVSPFKTTPKYTCICKTSHQKYSSHQVSKLESHVKVISAQ